MTRKRIRHEQICNEERRNATLRKRTEGLLKKAEELSILCGVDAAVVIHKRDQNNAVLWPSPAAFAERLQKFLEFRSEERERRSVRHEKHMKQMVEGEMEEIEKLKKMIKEKESQQLMAECVQKDSFDGIGLSQLDDLKAFAEQMLNKLIKRDTQLINAPINCESI